MRPDWRSEFGRGVVVVLVAAMLTATALSASGATVASGVEELGPDAVTYVERCSILDESGTYVLERDVETTADDCFRVTADDVRLLGTGHTVLGENATGSAVLVDDATEVHVEGLGATDWRRGVTVDGATNVTVADVTVQNVSADGVRISDSTDVTVVNGSVVAGGGHGVTVLDSENAIIEGMRLANNTGNGVSIRRSADTTVHGNAILDNGGVGVDVTADSMSSADRPEVPAWLLPLAGDGGLSDFAEVLAAEPTAGSAGTVVTDNTIEDNRYQGVLVLRENAGRIANNTVAGSTDGIRLINVSGASVAGNTISGSIDDGIAISWGSETNISDNTVSANGDDGVYVFGSGNVVANNTVANNSDDGLDLHDSDRNRVTANYAYGNGDDGVFFRESNGNTVVDNRFVDNRDDGFDIRGSTDNVIHNNTACRNDNHDMQIRLGVEGNEVRDNSC